MTDYKQSNGEDNNIFSPSSYELASTLDIEKLWDKIYVAIKSILNSEFSDDAKREPRINKDSISFACVYCGDSHSDNKKKRGTIYSNNMQYHCYNGDCKAHMSLYDFLNDKKRILDFTIDEQFYMKETSRSKFLNIKKIKEALGLETFISDEINDLSVDREFFIKKFNLQEIKGSRIESYLLKRLQKDFRKFAWDPKKGLLYVLNLTADYSRIIGLQLKTFNKRNPYITWKISRIHEELGIYKEENKEGLDKMDYLSTVFGIFTIDINKPVSIFEGPLDSFLFPNSVALCSAKNSMPFEIEGARYFYDNDETGRHYTIKKLVEGKTVFLWKKFLQENELMTIDSKIKDLNDLLIYIKRNQKKCKKIIDYFSNEKYDIIYV